MFVRRRRPLARAAMVGGAAYYAGKRGQERQQENDYRDARLDELEAQQAQQQQTQYAPPPPPPAAAPPPPAPAAGGMTDQTIEQLQKLAQLHEQGILTDDEFNAQKQKLLGAS
jgi:hypothetical protein